MHPTTPEAPAGYVLKRANPFNARWFWIGLAVGVVVGYLTAIPFIWHAAGWLSGG